MYRGARRGGDAKTVVVVRVAIIVARIEQTGVGAIVIVTAAVRPRVVSVGEV